MKYQTYAILQNVAKTIRNVVTHLMHNPLEDSLQGWVLHRKMSHAQPQTHFENHSEQQQKHLQDEQQAPRRNQTLKRKQNEASFVFRRALVTSLWKKWMATILFL